MDFEAGESATARGSTTEGNAPAVPLHEIPTELQPQSRPRFAARLPPADDFQTEELLKDLLLHSHAGVRDSPLITPSGR